MMKKLYLIIAFFFFFNSFAQNHRNANWVFGDKNVLSFLPTPTAGTIPSTVGFSTVEGCASVSDRSGNLIMFSDGVRLWYRLNGIDYLITSSLKGNSSSAQNVIFVPKPNTADSFYVITAGCRINPNLGLFYSEVRFVNGVASLISLNNVLKDEMGTDINGSYGNVSEAITSAPSSDPNEYWVITHVQNATKGFILSYKVTAAGINPNPQANEPLFLSSDHAMFVKSSQDNTKIALSFARTGIYCGSFNSSDGAVNITANYFDVYVNYYSKGIEFSPNSQLLYFTGQTQGNEFSISRINTSLSTSSLTTNILASSYDGLQLAKNGSIYIANNYFYDIGIITDPNNATNPTIIDGSMTFSNRSRGGLPQLVPEQTCEATLTDNVNIDNGSVLEERSQWIKATNKVVNNARLIYHAGDYIELLPQTNPLDSTDIGFEAEFGSQFVAEIVPCNSPFTYKNGEANEQTSGESKDFTVPSNKISIFPNPSNTSVTVSYNEALKNIRILSMDGKTIFTRNANEKEFQIEVSTFVNGMYLITVETQNGQFLQSKFIKN